MVSQAYSYPKQELVIRHISCLGAECRAPCDVPSRASGILKAWDGSRVCSLYGANDANSGCGGGFTFEMLDWRHPHQSWSLFAKPEFDASWFRNRPLTWNTFMDCGRLPEP
jgi:hypothetical protein